MKLEERIDALCSRRRFGMRPGLERMAALLERLGHPERNLAMIHVAGTNGKGAVTAIAASILQASGVGRVGRYTSPHLVYFNERICIDGEPVGAEALAGALDEVEDALRGIDESERECPTFFEVVSALAFVVFRREGVRIAVIETGLGGRLDATNVILPVVSVITSIGLEHCDYLGDTIESIAFEKAGIVKPGRPVTLGSGVVPAARAVIENVALERGAEIIDFDVSLGGSLRSCAITEPVALSFEDSVRSVSRIKFPLSGEYQRENLVTAINAVELFSRICGIEIPDEAFRVGISTVKWPCRFQVVCLDPQIIVDGAHNPAATAALGESLRRLRLGRTPAVLVAGFCGDKDALSALRNLRPHFRFAIAVNTPSLRTLDAGKLGGLMRTAGFSEVAEYADYREGLARAREWAHENGGLVLVCGSLFLAGAVAADFNALPWKTGVRVAGELLKAKQERVL